MCVDGRGLWARLTNGLPQLMLVSLVCLEHISSLGSSLLLFYQMLHF